MVIGSPEIDAAPATAIGVSESRARVQRRAGATWIASTLSATQTSTLTMRPA